MQQTSWSIFRAVSESRHTTWDTPLCPQCTMSTIHDKEALLYVHIRMSYSPEMKVFPKFNVLVLFSFYLSQVVKFRKLVNRTDQVKLFKTMSSLIHNFSLRLLRDVQYLPRNLATNIKCALQSLLAIKILTRVKTIKGKTKNIKQNLIFIIRQQLVTTNTVITVFECPKYKHNPSEPFVSATNSSVSSAHKTPNTN